MIHSLLRRFWCDCFICHSLRANHSFDFLGDLPIENLPTRGATSFSRKTWRHLWIVKNCNCSDIPPMRNSLGAFAFWQSIDCTILPAAQRRAWQGCWKNEKGRKKEDVEKAVCLIWLPTHTGQYCLEGTFNRRRKPHISAKTAFLSSLRFILHRRDIRMKMSKL